MSDRGVAPAHAARRTVSPGKPTASPTSGPRVAPLRRAHARPRRRLRRGPARRRGGRRLPWTWRSGTGVGGRYASGPSGREVPRDGRDRGEQVRSLRGEAVAERGAVREPRREHAPRVDRVACAQVREERVHEPDVGRRLGARDVEAAARGPRGTRRASGSASASASKPLPRAMSSASLPAPWKTSSRGTGRARVQPRGHVDAVGAGDAVDVDLGPGRGAGDARPGRTRREEDRRGGTIERTTRRYPTRRGAPASRGYRGTVRRARGRERPAPAPLPRVFTQA